MKTDTFAAPKTKADAERGRISNEIKQYIENKLYLQLSNNLTYYEWTELQRFTTSSKRVKHNKKINRLKQKNNPLKAIRQIPQYEQETLRHIIVNKIDKIIKKDEHTNLKDKKTSILYGNSSTQII